MEMAFYSKPLLLVIKKKKSVQFSRTVMSDCLRPYGLQHARLPYPSPTPRGYPNSCPLSQWCHPAIASSVSPVPPALILFQHQGLFQLVSSSHQVAKYWSFSFNISLSIEHPGLISFRMDWFDLLAVQGTLKSLLQHRRSKASILLHSAFFIVQLSHPYMTTGKTIALTRRTFVSKVMVLYIDFKYDIVSISNIICVLYFLLGQRLLKVSSVSEIKQNKTYQRYMFF